MRLGVAWAIATVCIFTADAHAQTRRIQELSWLVGEWTFEDYAVEGEYREVGTRVCEFTLGDEYIQCDSHGVDHRGNERHYIWFFNYNSDDERFEVTSLLQGFPRKLLYVANVAEAGRRLELTYGSWEGSEVVVDGGATVTYNGSDQYVWGNARFRDVVTRR